MNICWPTCRVKPLKCDSLTSTGRRTKRPASSGKPDSDPHKSIVSRAALVLPISSLFSWRSFVSANLCAKGWRDGFRISVRRARSERESNVQGKATLVFTPKEHFVWHIFAVKSMIIKTKTKSPTSWSQEDRLLLPLGWPQMFRPFSFSEESHQVAIDGEISVSFNETGEGSMPAKLRDDQASIQDFFVGGDPGR